MKTLIFVAVILICLIAGCLIGYVLMADSDRQRAPYVGSIDINLYDPSKELLSLQIHDDINPDDPPTYVLLKVNVLRASKSNR